MYTGFFEMREKWVQFCIYDLAACSKCVVLNFGLQNFGQCDSDVLAM